MTASVKLISYTRYPNNEYEGVNSWELQDQIAYCARVSNPANQDNKDNDRLIKYLLRNKHWSPFEMVNVVLEINTTRDIARQILRHRSFSFQEFSQRYADPTSDLNFVQRDARMEDPDNRQNSIDCQDLKLDDEWKYRQKVIENAVDASYRWARSHGIAKEQARAILPEGNTMSRLYMNGTLRSWIHYIELRKANGTQREHQEVAKLCEDTIAEIFPLIREIT